MRSQVTDWHVSPSRFALARVWQVVWGLPQTLVGLVLFCALRGSRQRYGYRSAVVVEWALDAGLSLGLFVFVPRGCPRALVAHEYGHTLQSLILGPLYLPLIVLPSLVWAGTPHLERMRTRRHYSYYRFLPERWANRISRRVTGEVPLGWYEPHRGHRGRRQE